MEAIQFNDINLSDDDFDMLFSQEYHEEFIRKINKDKENELEYKYQQSNFSKKWAKTRAEAIQKTKDEYIRALSIYNEWIKKLYKKTNLKIEIVDNSADAADDTRNINVYRINENKKKRKLMAQVETMRESISTLKKLGLTDKEITIFLNENL